MRPGACPPHPSLCVRAPAVPVETGRLLPSRACASLHLMGPASCGAPVLFLGASSREWWGRGRHASHPKQRLRVAIRWLACLLPGPAALLSLGLNSALIFYLPGTRATRASSNLGSPCAGSLSSVEQSKCK